MLLRLLLLVLLLQLLVLLVHLMQLLLLLLLKRLKLDVLDLRLESTRHAVLEKWTRKLRELLDEHPRGRDDRVDDRRRG